MERPNKTVSLLPFWNGGFVYFQKLASLCAVPVWKEHVVGGEKKGSGIGDFHNYTSQAFTTIQLTVFFLCCQVGLLWLSLMNAAPTPTPTQPQLCFYKYTSTLTFHNK